jgi:hypothetical protein
VSDEVVDVIARRSVGASKALRHAGDQRRNGAAVAPAIG